MTGRKAPELEFVLPGTWWDLPVTDPDAATRRIQQLVTEAVGKADKDAEVRRRLRSGLQEAVDTARKNAAQQIYLAREVTPGVPLSASLAVYWPDVAKMPDDVASSPKLARAFLKAALNGGPDPLGEEDEEEFSLPTTDVLRRTFLSLSELEAGGDKAEGGTLRVDYWLTVPDRERFALLSFSSSFVSLKSELLNLFDAVVSTVKWGDLSALDEPAGLDKSTGQLVAVATDA